MYISNQKRLRRYRKDRDAEQDNSDATQVRLYQILAEEAGEEEQATKLADMARRVGRKVFGGKNQNPIAAAVKGGYLNELIHAFRAMPTSTLSPKVQEIQRNLNDLHTALK